MQKRTKLICAEKTQNTDMTIHTNRMAPHTGAVCFFSSNAYQVNFVILHERRPHAQSAGLEESKHHAAPDDQAVYLKSTSQETTAVAAAAATTTASKELHYRMIRNQQTTQDIVYLAASDCQPSLGVHRAMSKTAGPFRVRLYCTLYKPVT